MRAHNFKTLISMKQISCVLSQENGTTEFELQNIVYMHMEKPYKNCRRKELVLSYNSTRLLYKSHLLTGI